MQNNKKRKLICIVGPTATGKTRLSVELAKKFNGEIVSADSMQVYRGMDIGTAKPDIAERKGVPHHMMDIISPFENYSVARFTEEATAAIEKIYRNRSLPIVVGGTGLYADSLIRKMDFAEYNNDFEYRAKLYEAAEQKGAHYVHKLLEAVDFELAEKLHENDLKRVIRALEVYKVTGIPLSEHNRKTRNYEKRYNVLYLGLNYEDRQKLYLKIDKRVDIMMERGFLEEVQRLISSGVPSNSTALQAIGYRELAEVCLHGASFECAISAIKQNSRRYAKRQLTWFRKNPDINWICVDKKEFGEILQTSSNFIKKFGIM